MNVEVAPHQLRTLKAWEWIVRFAFGGAIAVATGIIGKVWGPFVAGLFLAFPAILPASITLVKHHDGRAKAIDDARGARLGSLGLAAFAATVVVSAGSVSPWLVLVVASAMWLLVDVGAWFLRYSVEDSP